MKSITKFLIAALILMNVCLAGEIQYLLDIINIQTKSETFEFDIVLKNETSENFLYSAGQYFLELDGISSNLKELSCTIVKSDLPRALQPQNPKCSGNMLMLASNQIEKENTFTVSDKNVLIARVSMDLPEEFSSQDKISLTWTDEKNKRRTKIVAMQVDGKVEIIKSGRFFSESDVTSKLTKEIDSSLPEQFALMQNYPNPFNPVTKIKFEIPVNTKEGLRDVILIVYDVTGRELMTLVNEKLEAGRYEINFNGRNFASGVYFYKIIAREFNSVKRMVLLK